MPFFFSRRVASHESVQPLCPCPWHREFLRSAFGAHPNVFTTGFASALILSSCSNRSTWPLHFETETQVVLFNKIGEAGQPAGLESEDIVAEPDMVEPVFCFQHEQFLHHMLRAAGIVPVAIDGFGAPVTFKRASRGWCPCSGRNNRRVSATYPGRHLCSPGPRRERKRIQVFHHLPFFLFSRRLRFV